MMLAILQPQMLIQRMSPVSCTRVSERAKGDEDNQKRMEVQTQRNLKR